MTRVLVHGSGVASALPGLWPSTWTHAATVHDSLVAAPGRPTRRRREPCVLDRIADATPDVVLLDLWAERHGAINTDGRWITRPAGNHTRGLDFATKAHLMLFALTLDVYVPALRDMGVTLVVNDVAWATHTTDGTPVPCGRWHARVIEPYMDALAEHRLPVVSTRPTRADPLLGKPYVLDACSTLEVAANLADRVAVSA